MSQTPTLDSPIFSQLNVEFAAEGSSYEELVNWTTPEFVWDPNRPVVQLDKQTPSRTKVKKLHDAFGREMPEPMMVKAFVTDMRTEMNPDGSAMVVFEAVQPITPDMPLPDKDAAEPME